MNVLKGKITEIMEEPACAKNQAKDEIPAIYTAGILQ